MSNGICTNERFAILSTKSGIDLSTFATMEALAERAVCQMTLDDTKKVGWLRAFADRPEKQIAEDLKPF